MCSHYGYGQFHQGGEKIAKLQPGDEIIIPAGVGEPAPKRAVTDIIVAVGGCSALTAQGRQLSCFHGENIKPTGRHFDPSTVRLSRRAQKILKEAG